MMYSVIAEKREGDQRKQQVGTIHKTNIRRRLNMIWTFSLYQQIRFIYKISKNKNEKVLIKSVLELIYKWNDITTQRKNKLEHYIKTI